MLYMETKASLQENSSYIQILKGYKQHTKQKV